MFISLEGVDGVGKSSQLALLAEWLGRQGYAVVTCRDPGSTPLGEALRAILLERHDVPIDRRSEMLIYMAARCQLVEQVIRPALEAGSTVLCDRFLLSNVVYQGHAGGLDPQTIWEVGQVATGGLLPDLTIVLDMDAQLAQQRLDRALDRMETQGDGFLRRARHGFLLEAERHPNILVVDASRAVSQVQEQIRQRVASRWQPSSENAPGGRP